jgi:hypothetical protein
MRRLLPHSIAWLVTAWWVVTPVNFDALYEVHLFGVIPTLIAYLVALYKPTIWTRGAALGVFLTGAFLMRNELFIATGLWAAICFLWEIYQGRKRGAFTPLLYLRAYGIPILLTGLIVVFFYWRSDVKFPGLSAGLQEKHTLNVCQIYAFNYQQRNTDWTKSPWTECQDLMRRDFGVPQPSMTEAIRRNPRAMLDYFLWNVRLIPDGVQVLLFNATSGTGEPDYIPRILNSSYAAVLSILTLVTLVVGLWLLYRHHWWDRWIKERVWGWLALLCTVVVMFVVMLMQRPRPSYLFNLFYFLVAVIGMCVSAIVDRWIGIKRFSLVFPVIALALILLMPPYFNPAYLNPGGYAGRPLLTAYKRLAPFETVLSQQGVRILGTGWLGNLCYYVTPVNHCTAVEYWSFTAAKPPETAFADWLTEGNITLFYVDEGILADPAAQSFFEDPEAAGWETLAFVQTDTQRWRLLRRLPDSGG